MTKKTKILISVLCVLAIIVAAHLVFFLASPSHSGVCMIGHRGYSSKYYQNTEAAFIGAAEHGSGGIETDVRITADGVLVCSHDGTAHFKDGVSRNISDSTYEELTAHPIDTNKGKTDSYICTFERYLEICRDNNMICFIELKGEFPDDKLKECFELAEKIYDLKMCELQSFDINNLIKAHEMFPELKIMLTYGKDDENDYRVCFEYGFDIDMDYRVLSKEIVKEFHDRGLTVGAWTANAPYTLAYCYWFSPDYIESDVF